MHIAVCGPISLELLEPGLNRSLAQADTHFPMTAELVRSYVTAGHYVTVITTGTDIQEQICRGLTTLMW